MKDSKGYYKILGLKPDAPAEDIKNNYRKNAKKWHPDHNKSNEALEKFQAMSVAYNILQDDKTRLMYDILSEVYSPGNFPDMFALKVYKDEQGRDNSSLRAITQKQVIGKSVKEHKYICTYDEAKKKVLLTHLCNWFLGWLRFKDNIKAIRYNYHSIGTNVGDNLCLLVHNMIAYDIEGKKDKSYAEALQALEFANPRQQELIHRYMYFLGIEGNPKLFKWDYGFLRLIQFLVPCAVILIILAASLSYFLNNRELKRTDTIDYYQKVEFNTGTGTVDDVVVSKILNIPPDTHDLTMLYHVTGFVDSMYGPSDDFDVYSRLSRGQTVRLTGYSPDKVWARIMIDSGEMVFVRMNKLKKGIQNPIPPSSKIYTPYK